MKVKTSELKSIIKEAINNVINNPLQGLESKVEEASAETRNKIEVLNNKLSQLEKVMPTVLSLYDEISNWMPIAKTILNYERLEMIFEQPIPYNEDIDNYIEDTNNSIDDMLKDAIKVDYAFERNSDDGIVTGVYIEVELDQIQGWY